MLTFTDSDNQPLSINPHTIEAVGRLPSGQAKVMTHSGNCFIVKERYNETVCAVEDAIEKVK